VRLLAITAILLSALLALPAVQAYHPKTCRWDDTPCVVDCILFHDPCGIDISGSEDCPPLSPHLKLPVCVRTEPCPEPFIGVIVSVEGQSHGVCVR
jgi:hypothetical protein